jgi:hypothetical protein
MADREDQIRMFTQQYDKALSVIRNTASLSCPGKAGSGHEANYGQAYQGLVNLGVKPKLRLKYRG